MIKYLFLLLFFPAVIFAQDQKPAPPALLPFQQDAPKSGNEEQMAIQFYQNQEFGKAAELFEQLYEQKPSVYFYQYAWLSDAFDEYSE